MESIGSAAAIVATAIVWVGITAFFSLWIHRAEGNRALTMGLYIVFGAVSWFGFLFGLGNIYQDYRAGDPQQEKYFTWMFACLASGIALIPWTRRWLAKIIPFDPTSKPDMVGLALLGAAGVVGAVETYFRPNDIAPVTYTPLIVQALLFIVLAVFAVGLFVTRTPRETLSRLGLVVPTARQAAIAVGFVFVALAVAIASSLLLKVLQPDVYDQVQDNLETMTQHIGSIWGAAALGLLSGISEEVLFRGAIQPRFGIIFTALVFALLHVQYDASIATVGIFAAGIVFGIERKRLNTSSSIITHALYNTLAVIL